MLKWILSGCILVIVPFFIFYQPYNPWPSSFAAAMGGLIFFISFVLSILKKSQMTTLKKIISSVLLFVLAVIIVDAWSVFYEMTNFQRKTLGKIRVVSTEGIMTADFQAALMPPFRNYYFHGSEKSFDKIFYSLNKNEIKGKFYLGLNAITEEGKSSMKTIIQRSNDTLVELVSVDTVPRGYNFAFNNWDGSIGRVQMRAVLTRKGVSIEREN